MSIKRNNNQTLTQELILRGYKTTKEDKKHESSLKSIFTNYYSKLHQEEASMNQYMLRLKCLLKNLTLLEEGMVYVGEMNPIVFEPIYVLAQMQAKLYKIRNRLGHLPKEYRKYAHNLIENTYDCVIDQCVKGAQAEESLKKIVTDVVYIDDIVMKYHENNLENGVMPYQMNICPWLNRNNIRLTSKLPFKKINRTKFINNKNILNPKMKNLAQESSFLRKIEKVTRKREKKSCKTSDKTVLACIKTDNVGIQFDPELSGPIPIPKCFHEVENKIRSSWLANTKKSSRRASIEEKIPSEHRFQYEVSMRHATTNVISNKNTKETQTEIIDFPSEDYEYTVMDMTYTKERIINEKTEEEMMKDLTSKKVVFLRENDIFETMPSNKQDDSDSSSGTFIEDSDCNIKISNVESKPSYKKYKMLYTSNKNTTNTSSTSNKSVQINRHVIEHKDEILAYIKELSSIIVNSQKIESSDNIYTDDSQTT
ncbi:unnamed protein product [Nezara viridula]|uniref:Uncharacterized protein n=1 Tax=Nezara viridula TaxID=85310 RepID=A0A9P0HMN8_NEZVI|nr:unnamed protein product [Nezara viridula]